jgi:flagellar biosynthesis/type III secretory pathway protein FliH
MKREKQKVGAFSARELAAVNAELVRVTNLYNGLQRDHATVCKQRNEARDVIDAWKDYADIRLERDQLRGAVNGERNAKNDLLQENKQLRDTLDSLREDISRKFYDQVSTGDALTAARKEAGDEGWRNGYAMGFRDGFKDGRECGNS